MFGLFKKIKTRKIGILEIGQPQACNWGGIKEILSDYDKKLGPGWRTPTSEELEYMYGLHKMRVGGFQPQSYWSSEEANMGRLATAMSFVTGKTFYHSTEENFLLLPVRTINL